MPTIRDIDELPWLISAKDVHRVFGLDRRRLRQFEAIGTLHRCRKSRKGLWFKTELIQMVKVKPGNV